MPVWWNWLYTSDLESDGACFPLKTLAPVGSSPTTGIPLPRTLTIFRAYVTEILGLIMAKNEKSSKQMASLASKVLRESRSPIARKLAASVLTQTADRKRKGR